MYKSLQILRGLAAWLVVYFHFNQSIHNHRVQNFFAELISNYGDIGVDIFFVLSGFVMAASAPKYAGKGIQYAINRLVRIVPNYWFYICLLVVSIKLLPEYTYLTNWNHNSLIDSFLLIPNRNPSGSGYFPTLYVGWTLIYEMFFYMTLAACLLIKNRYSLLICALLLFLIPITPLKEWVFLGRGHLLLWEFLAGIIVYHIHIRRPEMPFQIALVFGAFIGVVWYGLNYGDNFYTRAWVTTLLVYTVVCTEFLYQKDNWLIRFLLRLGDYSYSTYLAHISILGWFLIAFGHRFNAFEEFLMIIGVFVVIYSVSWLTYKTIETGIFPRLLKALLTFIFHPLILLVEQINSRLFSKNQPIPVENSH